MGKILTGVSGEYYVLAQLALSGFVHSGRRGVQVGYLELVHAS